MGLAVVVIQFPIFKNIPSLMQAGEQFSVEQVVATADRLTVNLGQDSYWSRVVGATVRVRGDVRCIRDAIAAAGRSRSTSTCPGQEQRALLAREHS